MSRSIKKVAAPVPPPVDSELAAPAITDDMKEALAAMLPRMAKVPQESLLTLRIDIQAAANKARGSVVSLRAETARLKALPDFDIGCIEDVVNASYACTALLGLQMSAIAQATEAKLDPELENESNERKNRMLVCVSHYFGKHPVYGVEIADIRSGKGHEDKAHDLRRLSALYAIPEVAAMVTKDPMYYNPQDAPRALVLSKQIFDQLGELKLREEQVIALQLAQAWTLLNQAWEQVRRAAAFLYWDNPAKQADFPSLFTFGRSARSSSKTNREDTTGTTPENVTGAAV